MGHDSFDTDTEEELHMASSTVIIAVSVVAGVAVLLAIAVGIGLYLSRRRNRASKTSFDPSKMEIAASGLSSADKHTTYSSWQQPLLRPIHFPDSPPPDSKDFDRRSSWRSDNTYTNEWHDIPGSEEETTKLSSPPRTPPSLPRIDTSAPPQKSIAVLDVIQSGISPAPSMTTEETASLYSLPSAQYSIHDLQRLPSPPPSVPALPDAFLPKYSLADEPSPLTRGNTHTIAQMLKTRARRSAAVPKASRSDTMVSRIERMGSIRSPADHTSETEGFMLLEEEDGMRTPRQT